MANATHTPTPASIWQHPLKRGYGKFSLRLIGYAMFGTTFNLITRVGLPESFGTLKDCSLKINILPLNNYFRYIKIMQDGVNALSKIVLKMYIDFFVKQICQDFVGLHFGSFLWHVVPIPNK